MNWKSKDLSILNLIRNLKNRVNVNKLYQHTIELEGRNAVDLFSSNQKSFRVYFNILDYSSAQYTKESILNYETFTVLSTGRVEGTFGGYATHSDINYIYDGITYDIVIYHSGGGAAFSLSDDAITLIDSVKEIQ